MLYEYKDDIALVLSFDYGAMLNKHEIPFAVEHCKKLNIKHIIIDLAFIGNTFKSFLLSSNESVDNVPFRNGIMLAIACGYADNYGYKQVMIASNYDDSQVFPDCTNEFIRNYSIGFEKGTINKIKIVAPFMELFKEQIIKKGYSLGVNYAHTYSCYNGGVIHCGKCNACVNRKKSFLKSGITDPTDYVL